MTIQQALNWGIHKLKAKSTSPDLDTEVLLSYVLKKPKEFLYTNYDTELRSLLRNYRKLIKQRANGVPISYLTNEKEFYGLKFYVDKNVLIPRPETETLVDLVLKEIKDLRFKIKDLKILDLGTGSGCIAITLAKKLTSNIYASDVSQKALAIAKKNAKKLNARVIFKKSDLLNNWHYNFGVIVANLPYLIKLNKTIKYEPKSALLAKEKGLGLYIKLFEQLSVITKRPKLIAIEFDPGQKTMIKKLAAKLLPVYKVRFENDLSGKTRFLILSLS